MTGAMHDARDDSLDKLDSVEAALLGLTEAVAANHEHYERQFAEIRAMLEAIIKDQNVPYEKPAMGFKPE